MTFPHVFTVGIRYGFIHLNETLLQFGCATGLGVAFGNFGQSESCIGPLDYDC
jgi:hypothetical protein